MRISLVDNSLLNRISEETEIPLEPKKLEIEDVAVEPYPNPEEKLRIKEEKEAVGAILSQLPPEEELVIRLTIMEGFTTHEVGLSLGKTGAETREIKNRSLKMLREFARNNYKKVRVN